MSDNDNPWPARYHRLREMVADLTAERDRHAAKAAKLTGRIEVLEAVMDGILERDKRERER